MRRTNDRWYPAYHIAAPGGWINDPNGLCYFQGRYHVFFQHHPYGVDWGPMHWGHVSSTDLVTWRHETIALEPEDGPDQDGCWSGSAVVSDDKLYAFYTGHRWRTEPDDPDSRRQVQCLAMSEDGTQLTKYGVVTKGDRPRMHFRDPKVWRQGDTWCMIVGQRSSRDRGQIALYTSANLLDWSYAGVVYEHPDPSVYMLECPDMFCLGDAWVLVFSAMGMQPDGYMGRNFHNAGYVMGNWNLGMQFEPHTGFVPCDWGHNYYAPQSFEDPRGRRIQFGWMSTLAMDAPEKQDGWCGQLTLPRELTLDDRGLVRTRPAEECAQLLGQTHVLGQLELAPNMTAVLVDDLTCGRVDLTFDLARSNAERMGVEVHACENGHLYVGYDAQAGCVFVDRRCTSHGARGYRAVPVNAEELSLELWLDRGSIEVFVNDGQAVLSEMSYPDEGPRAVILVSEAGTTTCTAQYAPLK